MLAAGTALFTQLCPSKEPTAKAFSSRSHSLLLAKNKEREMEGDNEELDRFGAICFPPAFQCKIYSQDYFLFLRGEEKKKSHVKVRGNLLCSLLLSPLF